MLDVNKNVLNRETKSSQSHTYLFIRSSDILEYIEVEENHIFNKINNKMIVR